MITLKELKDKIEKIELEIQEKNISIENIYLQSDYMNHINDVELDFIHDDYYGVYAQINII